MSCLKNALELLEKEKCATMLATLASLSGWLFLQLQFWVEHILTFFFFKLIVSFFLFYFIFKFSWPSHVAGGIIVPRLEIELMPLALEAQSLNRWTTRQIPSLVVKEPS